MNGTLKERITLFYDEMLTQEIPKRGKKRTKISSEDFTILKYNEFENLIIYEYNLPQLKSIIRHYKQRITGNKTQLLNRIYNFLKYSYSALKIQKIWRGSLQRQFNLYHGPAFFKRSLCVNDTDFFTLESCKKIPYNQFFSFKDDTNFVYGFDILSIYNLFIKNGNKTENPYNKELLNKSILDTLRKVIKLSKLFKIPVETGMNQEEDNNEKRNFEMRVLSLFQYMDSLGNYTNIDWFNSLEKAELIKFIRELHDIWMYRAQLEQNIKREICPPLGNPFRSINIVALISMSLTSLQKQVLYIIEQFVKTGINRDSKILGTNYVLIAFTLVNQNAAEAMPWLYHSGISIQ